MFTVRIYGDDPQAGPGALLEEHEFTSEAEAREFARQTVRDGAARVTFDGADLGRFAVRSAERTWAYSGITAGEAQQIADSLTAHDGRRWTAEPIR